jgi:glutathione S-transferase
MLTLYDYLPSQNGWKVRQILQHLVIPYRTKILSIFEGEGQEPDYLAVNPMGAVPAIVLEDGRSLAESNAILFHLARDSYLLSDDPFIQSKTLQWLSFEADYIQTTLGSVRYWGLTKKLVQRPPELVQSRQDVGRAALAALERELGERPFLVDGYSIADISVYAYAHLAEDADVSLAPYPNVRGWMARVKEQPGHLAEVFPYTIDQHSLNELP